MPNYKQLAIANTRWNPIPSHAPFLESCTEHHGWVQLSTTVPASRLNPKSDVNPNSNLALYY